MLAYPRTIIIFQNLVTQKIKMQPIYQDKPIGMIVIENRLKARSFQRQRATQRMLDEAQDKAIAKQHATEQIVTLPNTIRKKISPLRVKRPV